MDSKLFGLVWLWIDFDFLHTLFLVGFDSAKQGLPRIPLDMSWKQCSPQGHDHSIS